MADEVPRSVVLCRRALGIAGFAALLYVALAPIELARLVSGKALVASEIGEDYHVFRIANSIHDFTVATIVLCSAAIVTMLPFALFTPRLGPRARTFMIVACVLIGAWSILVMAADGSTLLAGDVVEEFGPIYPERAVRYSDALVAGWFPLMHYLAVFGLLVGSGAGFIALISSDTGEYFNRHRSVGRADPRVWTIPHAQDKPGT
jgi:hypothetical protein